MARHIVISIFAIILVGCASSGGGSGNYIYAISKDDKFALKKELAIAARDAHVLLQEGKVKKFANVDKYAPFCRFEVNTKGKQTIKPEMFTVTKVAQQTPEVLPGVYNYVVKFYLTATNNTNIRSLACGAWGSNTDTYLTFAQMQQALGSYFQTPMPK
ncbi:MAG: hypothetical protein HKM94_03510 [Halobacteria archaeon]|nr:hypothetical protein [Halobacteria archaeon]